MKDAVDSVPKAKPQPGGCGLGRTAFTNEAPVHRQAADESPRLPLRAVDASQGDPEVL